MPLIDDKAPGFQVGAAPEAKEPEAPGFTDTWAAGFRLENDVVNAVKALSQPAFEPDLNYNLGDDIRQYDQENSTDFFDNYRDNFTMSLSKDETRYIMNKITQERQDRETLAEAGFGGMVAAVGAGLLSPTTFIPLVGPMTKAGSAWQFAKQAAAIGGSIGVAQEALFQDVQETRSWAESALGVASQTIVSGVLGAAVGHVTAKELAIAAKSLDNTELAITQVKPGSVGAASVDQIDVGSLAHGGQTVQKGLDKTRVARNPVSFNVMEETWAGEGKAFSPTARHTATQLGDGGFRFEGNATGIPAAKGGTIENLIQTHFNVYPDIIRDLDEGFLKYRFDGAPPARFGGTRAAIQDLTGATEKLTKDEYKAAISEALRNGDTHEIPQVAATAKTIREKLFNPLLKQAQAVGLVPDEIDLKGDMSWVLRDYDRAKIKSETREFVETLASHFETKLQDDFAEQVTKLKARQARTEELVTNLQRPKEEVDQLREKFMADLAEMDKTANAEQFSALEDTVASLRAQARALKNATSKADQDYRAQLLGDAKDMEVAAGEPFKEFKKGRADVRRRLRDLSKSAVVLEEKQSKKLAQIENLEDASLGAMRRAARVGQRVLKSMSKWSDKKLDAEIGKLKTQFNHLAEVYDRGVAKAAEASNTLDPDKIELIGGLQKTRAEKMNKIAEKLDDIENLDRAEIRQTILEAQDEALSKIQDINARRAVRASKLEDAAAKLDPAQVARRVDEIKAKSAMKEQDFFDKWRLRGADDVDLDKGQAVFKDYALQQAEAAKDQIMGTFVRLPSIARSSGLRGSELARVLDVPSGVISKYLNNDIEHLMRQTLRTLVPDIEISKRFGDPWMSDILGDPEQGAAGKLAIELNERLDAVHKWGKAQVKEGADKVKIEAEVAKRTEHINDTYAGFRRNIDAMQGRLRHTWGLPQDPESMGFRMGKAMLNLNTTRLMGGVLISSIPDVGRPVFRYGLTRTMRDGFIPLITNFKNMKLTMKQVKALSGGLDATMQSRASAIFDLLDDVGRGSKFEQVLEGTSKHIGMVGLFDKWTSGMKQFSGAVAHTKFMDAIDTVIGGGSKIDLKEATRFLAENGIDGELAEKIWVQMTKKGGADKVDGRWWPNTELWDADIRQVYSQALTREVNNSIITPGIDKPLWVDQNITGRLLGQFKSFAVSSTSRATIAGLQQRDAAVFNGVMISLSMGALSYYLYAMAAGGRTKQTMLNAGPDKWADEAINRSGLLGIFSEVQRIAENIPATQPYATFSGTRSTRRGGDNLVEALGGPSLSALGTAADVVSSIHEPTDTTIHQARTLVPFQNIFYLRWLFDTIEQAIPTTERVNK